jgi:hypothetical protein
MDEIIEAATLGLRLYQIKDEGEELERVGHAFDAALSRLAPEDISAMHMAMFLLDGKPYLLTSNNPDNIRRCIAIAHKISATVENSENLWDDTPGLRSIMINPPSQAKQ